MTESGKIEIKGQSLAPALDQLFFELLEKMRVRALSRMPEPQKQDQPDD